MLIVAVLVLTPLDGDAQTSPVEGTAKWVFPDNAVDNRASVNGCGSQLEGSVDPPDEFVFLGDDLISFNEACNWHDRCYGTKGVLQQYCDLGMYARMTAACLDAELPTTVPSCQVLAELAYLAVKVGGQSSYLEGQEAACGRDPVRHARAHGDPHLVTLDGRRYSFQAAGEFVLLQGVNGTPILNAQFYPSSDTFSMPVGIAVKVGDSVVAVQRHIGSGTVRATVDGKPVDSRLTTLDAGYIMFGSQFAGTDGIVSIRHHDGLRVDALLHGSRLDLVIDVPRGTTGIEGLLGNNNGDPTDDLQAAGERISEDAIYDGGFREHWVVAERDSLFVAENSGFDFFSSELTSFPTRPLSVSDFSQEQQDQARQACEQAGVSGADMPSCVFDVLASGDVSIALAAARSERHSTTITDPGAGRLVPDPLLVDPASRGLVDEVRALLADGADPNEGREGDRATPIAFAAQNGHVEVVRVLLEDGAAPDLRVDGGYTALTLAAQNGHRDIVELLIDAGSYVDNSDDRELTPLYLASQNGQAEIVDLLLRQGAEVDHATGGLTPLSAAAQNGHSRVVEALLSAGARADDSTLYIAAQNGYSAVVKALVGAGATVDSIVSGRAAIGAAAGEGHIDTVRVLIELGADPDGGNAGSPPVVDAAFGDAGVLALLLASGADPEAADDDGFTATHVASQIGDVEMIMLLVQSGGNVNSATNTGWTPLHAAAARNHLGAVAELLRAGADEMAMDDQGARPSDFTNDPDVLELLRAQAEGGP